MNKFKKAIEQNKTLVQLIKNVYTGHCENCPWGNRYGCVGDVKCKINGEYYTGNVKRPYKERPDDCPLIEIADN